MKTKRKPKPTFIEAIMLEGFEMTWEEKLSALQNLAPTHLEMRKPGDWFVHAAGRYLAGGGLSRGIYGNGTSPEKAVENDWLNVTSIPDDYAIRVDRLGMLAHYRWVGYLWQPVPPPG